MKKILLILLIPMVCKAQDSTKIKGIQLTAKLLEYVIHLVMNPENDSLYQVYIDLRPKFRVANPPSNQTLVTIDSIPAVELANIYNYTLSNSEGMGMNNDMKSQIASARATNTYLDRLCSAFEQFWKDRLSALRISGRKILRGK